VTFAAWYAANIEPAIIQQANNIADSGIRAVYLKAARDSMAACWNAALDSVVDHTGGFVGHVELHALKVKL
jgi:hypothetical protein